MHAFTVHGEYLGGHPQHRRKMASAGLTINDQGVRLTRTFGSAAVQLAWQQVVGLAVDGDPLESRVTVTRLALIGPFALAAKKKRHSRPVVTITDVDGALLSVRSGSRRDPAAVRAALAAWTPHIAGQERAGTVDTVGQLQQLAELRQSGALDDREFAAAKAQLLAGG